MKLFLLYIDPGSGSYLVQLIIAAVLGGAYYLKSGWGKIKRILGMGTKNEKAENPEEHGE